MPVGRLNLGEIIFLAEPEFVPLWSIDFCWCRVDGIGATLVCVGVGRVPPCCGLLSRPVVSYSGQQALGFGGPFRASEYGRVLLSLYFLNLWDISAIHHFSPHTLLGGPFMCLTPSSALIILRSLLWCVGQGIRGGDCLQLLNTVQNFPPTSQRDGPASLSLFSLSSLLSPAFHLSRQAPRMGVDIKQK